MCPGEVFTVATRADPENAPFNVVVRGRPHRLQHLLSRAVWDEDTVRTFVAGHLGAGGILIFNETGDLKRGRPPQGPAGSTPAPPGGTRTRSPRSTPPTLQPTGTR